MSYKRSNFFSPGACCMYGYVQHHYRCSNVYRSIYRTIYNLQPAIKNGQTFCRLYMAIKLKVDVYTKMGWNEIETTRNKYRNKKQETRNKKQTRLLATDMCGCGCEWGIGCSVFKHIWVYAWQHQQRNLSVYPFVHLSHVSVLLSWWRAEWGGGMGMVLLLTNENKNI
jgi:hypothetical protein